MKYLFILFSFSFFILSTPLFGQGMWIPSLLKSINEPQMKSLGMEMSAEQVYAVNESSLKDAIVSFGGFCTAEIISPEGLLLTNHHCGYGQIQTHSSLENNYLEKGFWAMSGSEELPNPGLTATLIRQIENVTDEVLAGVSDEMTPTERQSVIDQNINAVLAGATPGPAEEVMVKPYYKGNMYFLITTLTYEDVRLVGAPPSSIGKFGADTDNWVWPRHTGDFALFRIYADSSNMPAAYSPSNVPYRPAHYLPVSVDGVEEKDFTLVFGFPGRTDEYLPAVAVEQIVEVLNPARIAIREKALSIVDSFMRADEGIRIQYASKFARIANYWKKWIGESQGLTTVGAIGRKLDEEASFQKSVESSDQYRAAYSTLLPEFERLYTEIQQLALTREYYNEVFNRNIELLRVAGLINRLPGLYKDSGQAGYDGFKMRLQAFLSDFYKDFQPQIDRKVCAALTEMFVQGIEDQALSQNVQSLMDSLGTNDYSVMASWLYDNSLVANSESVARLFEMPAEDAINVIESDPLVQFADQLKTAFDRDVAAPYNLLNAEIEELQRKYMKARILMLPGNYYPDANSTLRVTYGQVLGYTSYDGTSYDNQTWLSGLMDKYKPGDYEFDVPEKLRQLYADKDYGPYATPDGQMPVCFIGSNHTTGGNSGSPAIDAYGNLIGLNFDRVWEGTMSDINYDKQYCRNIMVDARYILFIIDKFAGATHLVEEMTLVRPKQPGYVPDWRKDSYPDQEDPRHAVPSKGGSETINIQKRQK